MEKLSVQSCKCGGEAKINMTVESGVQRFYVHCNACGLTSSTNKSPVKAVARWTGNN